MNDQQKFPFDPPLKARRVQGGRATSDVVTSCHLGDNAGIFHQILHLHVPKGSIVADITYGRGAFWKNVPPDHYTVLASDLKLGTRWDNLPYEDQSIDALIFDPPYMEGLYRTSKEALAGSGTHRAFQDAYSDGEAQKHKPERKYHDAVLEAYLSVMPEVKRLLRPSGKFVVKCQDEVSANRQKLTHVELMWAYERHGFYCKDLFVVMRTNAPVVSRLKKQEHARKNHSTFWFLSGKDHQKRLAYSNFSAWLRD